VFFVIESKQVGVERNKANVRAQGASVILSEREKAECIYFAVCVCHIGRQNEGSSRIKCT
jgi:hypothetical protein